MKKHLRLLLCLVFAYAASWEYRACTWSSLRSNTITPLAHTRLDMTTNSECSRDEPRGGRVRRNDRDRRFHVILTALLEYEAIHGDMYVPSRFVVPSDNGEYSPAVQGLRLGQRVQALRVKSIFKDARFQRQLNDVGFPWHAQHKKKEKAFERFLLGVVLFRRYYLGRDEEKDAINDISYDFVVPSDESKWPAELWGYHLGRKVVEIRRGSLFSSPRYQKLLAQEGLEVIPSNPSKAVAGLGADPVSQRGNATMAMNSDRHGGKKMNFGYIGEIGGTGALGEASFEAPRRRDRRRFKLIMASLHRFQEEHGHLDVPRDYVDAYCDSDLSKKSPVGDGGDDEHRSKPLKLGVAVANIRRGTAYSDLFFAAQLDRLGFVWQGRRGRRRKK